MRILFKSIKDGWILLTEKGSRFRIIFAGTLLAFAFVTPMMLGVYSSFMGERFITDLPEMLGKYLTEQSIAELGIPFSAEKVDAILTAVAYDLTAFFGIFITLPAFACFLTYAWRVYSNTRYGFVDSEHKKGRGYGYFRSLMAGAVMLFRPFICFIIFQAGYLLSRVLTEEPVLDGVYVPMILPLALFWTVGAVLSLIFLWATNSKFYAPYYYARGMSIREANRRSKKLSAAYPFMCDAFSLIFGALAILSVISVGVLFMLLVLPLMMFTYFSLAEHLDGKKLLED